MTFFITFKSNSIFGDSQSVWSSQVESGFWISTIIPWTASVFFGGFFAAIIGRVNKVFDGMLLGIATWAASLLIFGTLTSLGALSEPPVDFDHVPHLFGIGFLANAFGLFTAVIGGVMGVLLQSKKSIEQPQAERKDRGEKSSTAEKHSYGNAFR